MNPNPDTRGLRPSWKKGDPSPNPSGRPKRLPISDALANRALQPVPTSIRQVLERAGVTLLADATYADAVATQLFLQAISGDVAAAREIREATEGKAGQRIGPADVAPGPVMICVKYEDDEPPKQEEGTETKPMDSEVQDGAAKTPAPRSP